MILVTTALALAGALFALGAQAVRIAALSSALHVSFWLLVVVLIAVAAFALHALFMLRDRS